MKNNLHTELRKQAIKELEFLLTPATHAGRPPTIDFTYWHKKDNVKFISEKMADWWLSKLDELQSATSPDAIVKHDTLESLIDELGKNFRNLFQYENNWIAESNTIATGDEGTSHYIYATGSTPKEAVEKLLEELKKR